MSDIPRAPDAGHDVTDRRRRTQRLRWGTAWVLVALASLCIAFSAVAVWSHRVLLNTDEFVSTVEPIVRDPAVADAVSTTTSEQIVSALNIDQRARDALPQKAQFLATPL